jgi:hypothetical protein
MRHVLRLAMILLLAALAGCSEKVAARSDGVADDNADLRVRLKAAEDDAVALRTEVARLQKQLAVAAEKPRDDTKADRDATITRLTEETIAQGKRLQELAATYEGFKKNFEVLVSERNKWLNERDEAVARCDQFTKMYSDLEVKYRTDQANLAKHKEDLLAKDKVIADLQGRLTSHPDVRIPEKPSNPPAPVLQGKITAVDNEAKAAEIDIGSDAGVAPGAVFIVYRESGSKFLAELTIKKVGPKSSAGDLSIIRGTVEIGDRVTRKAGN